MIKSGEQCVAARVVPVQRARRETELAGDRAHRQRGGTRLGQVGAGDPPDVDEQFRTGAGPARPAAVRPCLTATVCQV